MDAWHDYWTAQVGASAALIGLLFVSLSINLSKILASASLTDRSAIPLVLLSAILISSSLLLAPGQPAWLVAAEILVGGIIVWAVVTYLDYRRVKQIQNVLWQYERLRLALTQIAAVPYIFAGILLWVGNPNALYLLLFAAIVSYLKSIGDTWVLLVEINR